MPTKTQKEKPPNYQTVMTTGQFSERVAALRSGVDFGDDPTKAAERVRIGWRRLDPLETAVGISTDAERAHYDTALGRGVEITRATRKARWPVAEFRRGLLLDSAGVELGLSRIPETSVRANLESVLSDTDKATGSNTGQSIDSTFDNLSARAMLLYLETRKLEHQRMEPWQRRGREAIMRASLGSLIKRSVSGLESVYGYYNAARAKGGDGSHVSGRLVEGVYFTYRLMDMYRSEGLLNSGYPRFALFREDKPMITTIPPRSFDVAVVRSTEPSELVQIKSQHNSTYAEGITVWRPQGEVIGDAPQIIEWFDTLVDNEAPQSRMDGAWRNLSMRLGVIGQAAA